MPLGSDLRGRTSSYTGLHQRLAALSDKVQAAIDEDEARCDAALLALWLSGPLRDALVSTQPDLHNRVAKLIVAPSADPKKWRRMRLTLLSYIQRLSAKTSPMGQMGAAGFAGGEQSTTATPHVVRLAVPSARALIDRCLNLAGDDTPLFPNPSLKCGTDGAVSALVAGNSTSTASLKSLEDQSKAALICLLVLSQPGKMTPWTLRDVAHTLIGTASRDQIARLVHSLIAEGFLQRSVPFDESCNDLARRLADTLTTLPNDVIQTLHKLQAALDDLATSETPSNEKRGTAIELAQTLLDADGSVTPDVSVTVTPAARAADPPDLVPSIKVGLALLTTLLPLFATEQSARVALNQAFDAEFGAMGQCDDVVGFLAGLDIAMFGQSDLQAARQAKVLDLLLDQMAVGKSRLTVDPAVIRVWQEMSAEVASAGAGEVAIFGHLSRINQAPAFIFNRLGPGAGTMTARHLSGSDEARAFGADLAVRLSPAKPIELAGHFGFSGETCESPGLARLLYPGEAGASGLAWSDLRLRRDGTGALTLCLSDDPTPLAPVHFGTLAPQLLPPIVQRMLLLGPVGFADMPLLDLLDARRANRAADQCPLLRHYPRLEVQGLVLMRESWRMTASHVPRPPAGANPFECFRQIDTWRRDLGLPDHVYMTPMSTAEALELRGGRIKGLHRLRKPVFVDLTDPGSVRVMMHYFDPRSNSLTFAEALPDPLANPDAVHSEWVLERRGRR
nr:lantibiotic dehydratase [Phaeobacter sp.]